MKLRSLCIYRNSSHLPPGVSGIGPRLRFITTQVNDGTRENSHDLLLTQHRISQASDILFKTGDPIDKVRCISTTRVEPFANLTPDIHRLSQLQDLLPCSIWRAGFHMLGILESLVPLRLEVFQLSHMSSAPRLFFTQQRLLTLTSIALQSLTNVCDYEWRSRWL